MNLNSTINLYANRKLHYRTSFQGIPISVENRKGSIRKGVSANGPWETKMQIPYGYVKGSKHIGMDGDELDVFVGPDKLASEAYIIMIKKAPDFKQDDEEKALLGFSSALAAKKAFLAHYNNPRFFGSMRTVPMSEFRTWIDTKPVKKVAANTGEPGVYNGGMAHIDPQPSFHPPSLRNPQYVPTDDPREKDDRFGDVTKRNEAVTKHRRDSLTKQHTDGSWKALSSTQVSGFPSGTVGGFG